MPGVDIDIPKFEDPTALLRPDQHGLMAKTENIYLVLDVETERVFVTTATEAEREGTSVEVPANRRFRVRLPDAVDASQLREWVRARKWHFERVFEGCSLEWGESEMVCRLDQEAQRALSQLQSDAAGSDAVPTHEYQLWEASRWLDPLKETMVEKDGRPRKNKGEALSQIVEEVEEQARGEGVLLYGTEDAIRSRMEVSTGR
jgi:hypothetical protein